MLACLLAFKPKATSLHLLSPGICLLEVSLGRGCVVELNPGLLRGTLFWPLNTGPAPVLSVPSAPVRHPCLRFIKVEKN